MIIFSMTASQKVQKESSEGVNTRNLDPSISCEFWSKSAPVSQETHQPKSRMFVCLYVCVHLCLCTEDWNKDTLSNTL